MKRFLHISSILLIALSSAASLVWPDLHAAPAAAPAAQAVQRPALKWQRGGCHETWCDAASYSSPAVADLDGDGKPEVIGNAYRYLFALDGETGLLKNPSWRKSIGDNSAWPGVVTADVDGDGDLEIVIAQFNGYLHLFDHLGNKVWTRQPTTNELRGLSVYDLDNDGSMEIVVTGGVYSKVNTWVYEHTGALRAGWPQLSVSGSYAYGVFNDNAAVGDLDGDGRGEIVVPSDLQYICAYEANGSQIQAHSMYGAGVKWGGVETWESLDTELSQWGGSCKSGDGRAERYRLNFAHNPAVIADVNGDGIAEVIATGNVYDCSFSGLKSRYTGLYIFNADRSRFNMDGFDWRTPPVDTGAPLNENDSVIKIVLPNPVVVDLDGDGLAEILFPSYDGRMHAFWLDKTEHGNWPFSVYDPAEGFYRFASEPVVADLNNDGKAEVIFGSWPQRSSNRSGHLYVLDYLGNLLHKVPLPDATEMPNWNGSLGAPTLSNIDGDPDLEVVLATAWAGLVAYDLPGTANARILWATGRGNFQRTGSALQGSVKNSLKSMQPPLPGPGDTLAVTIVLHNPGLALPNVRVTDTLPAELHYAGGLWASAGSASQVGGTVTWSGSVLTGVPVTLTFSATVDSGITEPHFIRNTALIDDGMGHVWEKYGSVVANGHGIYFPQIMRYARP